MVIPSGDESVSATDPRIQYDPPMNDSNTWDVITKHNLTFVQTNDSQATVTFSFQGAQTVNLNFVDNKSSFPQLLVTVDGGQGSTVTPPMNANGFSTMEIADIDSESDATKNHTVKVQVDTTSSEDSQWNIIGLSLTTHSSITSPSPIGASLPSVSPTIQSSPAGTSGGDLQGTKKHTAGSIAGAVIGSFAAVGLVGILLACLYRRHRRSAIITPEPLVITSNAPRRNRSRFQRIYSDRLPHFTAPSSVWPTSEVRTTLPDQPPLPISRESTHEKITPFALPTLTPALPVSVPKQRKSRQLSSFFVANPSSHSSRSGRTQSLKTQRTREDNAQDDEIKQSILPSREGGPWPEYDLEEKGLGSQQAISRLAKGKQRAIDFEIDPAPNPPQSRVKRGQSLRRFFTTNPNPSTSSSSSTSSRQVRSSKRAAVAEYVRSQIQQRPGREPILTTLPMTEAMPSSLPFTTTAATQARIPPPSFQGAIPQLVPTRKRQSQTLFFTSNPNPSTYDVADDHLKTELGLSSEIPPPKIDKGKGRAF